MSISLSRGRGSVTRSLAIAPRAVAWIAGTMRFASGFYWPHCFIHVGKYVFFLWSEDESRKKIYFMFHDLGPVCLKMHTQNVTGVIDTGLGTPVFQVLSAQIVRVRLSKSGNPHRCAGSTLACVHGWYDVLWPRMMMAAVVIPVLWSKCFSCWSLWLLGHLALLGNQKPMFI